MSLLWLFDDAASTIRQIAVSRRLHETGGAMFGYVGESGDVVISEAYGPGPAARHERFRVVPDVADTRRRIDEVHERTQGRLSYLGDWHTHPGGRAAPSGRDTVSLRELADDPGMDLPGPVIAIVATTVLTRRPRVRALRAFRWSPADKATKQLPINTFPRADEPAGTECGWGAGGSGAMLELFAGDVGGVGLPATTVDPVATPASDTDVFVSFGGVVILDILVGGGVSGASMNPARSFGPALASGTWDHFWIWIGGPVAGTSIGALAYQFIRGEPPRPTTAHPG